MVRCSAVGPTFMAFSCDVFPVHPIWIHLSWARMALILNTTTRVIPLPCHLYFFSHVGTATCQTARNHPFLSHNCKVYLILPFHNFPLCTHAFWHRGQTFLLVSLNFQSQYTLILLLISFSVVNHSIKLGYFSHIFFPFTWIQITGSFCTYCSACWNPNFTFRLVL